MRAENLYEIEKVVRKVLREMSNLEGLGILFKELGFEDLLYKLPERERKVLEMRLGIDGDGTKTLEEVGKEFGVTRERIRGKEAKAMKLLKKEILSNLNNK